MLNSISAIRKLTLVALMGFCTFAEALVLRDDRQMDVSITKPPQRIVSLLP